MVRGFPLCQDGFRSRMNSADARARINEALRGPVGFRAEVRRVPRAADVADGKAELISRRGNVYKSWLVLREAIGRELEGRRALLDGELVCLDSQGRPVFLDMLYRRRRPLFVAFDLLYLDGEDMRELALVERKLRLRELVPNGSRSPLYAQHVERTGRELFAQACALHLEGIVAKLADVPYRRRSRRTGSRSRTRPTRRARGARAVRAGTGGPTGPAAGSLPSRRPQPPARGRTRKPHAWCSS